MEYHTQAHTTQSLFVMAGLVQVALRKTGQEISSNITLKEAIRLYASSSSKRNKTTNNTTATGRRIDSVAESLASKGFLRSTKPYAPPQNVAGKVKEICESLKVPGKKDYALGSLEEKFTVLEACSNDFMHSVPNSQLYEIKTIDDIVRFYETPVDTTVPLDAMKQMELPENLHIQYEYHRFNPETDTMFGGQSAFPKSSTLVTGLKYRGKYLGYNAKRSWP